MSGVRRTRHIMVIEVARDIDTGELCAAAILALAPHDTINVPAFDTLGACLDGVARATLEHPDYQRHERYRHGRR